MLLLGIGILIIAGIGYLVWKIYLPKDDKAVVESVLASVEKEAEKVIVEVEEAFESPANTAQGVERSAPVKPRAKRAPAKRPTTPKKPKV